MTNKYAWLAFFCLMFMPLLAGPSLAQDMALDTGRISRQPICFQVENASPNTVFGLLVSDVYTALDGTVARHHSEFRLESHHFAQFCSTGPFYPGDKLDLQLRSLFPVFECRTGLSGPIVIHGQQQEDGTYKTWADCL